MRICFNRTTTKYFTFINMYYTFFTFVLFIVQPQLPTYTYENDTILHLQYIPFIFNQFQFIYIYIFFFFFFVVFFFVFVLYFLVIIGVMQQMHAQPDATSPRRPGPSWRMCAASGIYGYVRSFWIWHWMATHVSDKATRRLPCSRLAH